MPKVILMISRTKEQVKFKLRNFDTVVYDEEIQEVRYLYTIEDSGGFLEMDLTIPADADPVEQFCLHIKDLYRGYINYVIYHSRYKYNVLLLKPTDFDYQLHRTRMW